jgi:hypothetical protein
MQIKKLTPNLVVRNARHGTTTTGRGQSSRPQFTPLTQKSLP